MIDLDVITAIVLSGGFIIGASTMQNHSAKNSFIYSDESSTSNAERRIVLPAILSRELNKAWAKRATACLYTLVAETTRFNRENKTKYSWSILDIKRTKQEALRYARQGKGSSKSLHINGRAIDLQLMNNKKMMRMRPYSSGTWQPLDILRAACKRHDINCGLMWKGNRFDPKNGLYYDPGHIEDKPYAEKNEANWFEKKPKSAVILEFKK